MKLKFGVKQIVLLCVTALLIGVLIAANILLNLFSPILHRVFGGDHQVAQTEQAQNALAAGNELVQELAEDSIVLLTNKDNALPLDMDVKVNLFGWNATDQGFLLSGGGSGGTAPSEENKVTLTQALEKEGMEYNKDLLEAYSKVSNADADKGEAHWLYNPGQDFYTDERMNDAYDYSDVAIVVLSRFGRENGGSGELVNVSGSNYKDGAILELTANEKIMFNAVKNTFGGSGKIIVLLNTCNNMELAFLEDYDVDAALYVGIPGQSGSLAIPRILRGRAKDLVENADGTKSVRYVTPSGKTADIYPYSYNPENGKNYNSIWINAISNGESIVYSEGIYYGYKWYETADVEGFFDEVVRNDEKVGYDAVVQFPFGHGLSYADFKWTIVQEPEKSLTENGKYELKVRVENISKTTPGKDVVQLYYTPQYNEGGIEKAAMNLLAFDKTVELEPGASQEITLKFSAYDLASYDDYDKNNNKFTGYELEKGKYTLKLMKDSHNPHECYSSATQKTSNEIVLDCDKDIKFETDPVTGKKVENRFTGDSAYGKTPIDGTTVNSNIKYLSRKGKFENFKSITKYYAAKDDPTTNDVYNGENISDIKFGVDAGLYLITDSNGYKVTLGILDGSSKDNNVTLEYNIDLMLDLADYDNEELWNLFLNQMTWEETLDLIGKGGFQTIAVESIGKPRATDLDGPAGFNSSSVTDPSKTSQWTAFPSEGLIGCSWSRRLLYNMGRAQGLIASNTGINGWYGPGVNLHRSPYNSRNFEYYSEDGLLSGKLAAEVIRGAKQSNTYCYIKHYAASEAGQNPNNWYTWLTEQNLRENYLRPFEIAVKEGGANAIMSAFNRVGKDWAGRNAALSIDILRTEWGFKGSMITDWYNAGFMSYRAGVLGGNDLWLAGTNQKRAEGFSKANTSDVYATRRSVKNILYTYVDTYVTAYNYAQNGDPDDPYKVDVNKVNITAAPFSGLFVFLWVLIDVLIVGGMAVCVLFFFLSQKDKKGNAPTET